MTMPSSAPPRVAIIGGGFGGIAAAVNLQRRGIHDFVIFEAGERAGGTWWHNRYPGAEVDIPSVAYSLSFMPYDWSSTHASQAELLDYVDATVERFGLADRFRFGARVEALEWQEEAGEWLLTLRGGEQHRFRAVISALGLLSYPHHPDWPGLDEFEGTAIHTTELHGTEQIAGKRVAVVGTGSTSVQLVPAIAEDAEHVTVFQREPGWLLPKGERPYTEEERERYRRSRWAFRLDRYKAFHGAFKVLDAFEAGSKRNAEMQAICRGYIEATIEDPAIRTAVTPDTPWACKRPLFSSTFYPALNRPDVDLVPRAVTRVTPRGVVDADGVEHEVDVLIMSTGFEPTNFLPTLSVTGRDGQDIKAYWGDRPRAFVCASVPGFPNLFLLYGPNSNGGFAITSMLERQAEMAARALRKVLRRGIKSVDTSESATRRWVRWVDGQQHRQSAADSGACRNYYHSPSGANVTQWPRSAFVYWLVSRFAQPWGLTYQR